MADDVLLNKAATIERCVARVREEFNKDQSTFAADFTRQDAAILNIQRAYEAALDMGHHVIRRDQLGLPQSARDVFERLHLGGKINAELTRRLQAMVGFRNIAVRDYQKMLLPIVEAIIREKLDDLLAYSRILLTSP
jgi:uncharacterized protein YutE (UPF0331/DUF86 family)